MKARLLPALIGGVVAALICLYVAFLMTGAGHGWITPFWFSLGGFLVFPVGLGVWLAPATRRIAPIYGILLLVALVSDVMLYVMSDAEGWQYFHRAAPFNYVWLALWSLWQFAILSAFLTALQRPVE